MQRPRRRLCDGISAVAIDASPEHTVRMAVCQGQDACRVAHDPGLVRTVPLTKAPGTEHRPVGTPASLVATPRASSSPYAAALRNTGIAWGTTSLDRCLVNPEWTYSRAVDRHGVQDGAASD
jgi:hypothetical protein